MAISVFRRRSEMADDVDDQTVWLLIQNCGLRWQLRCYEPHLFPCHLVVMMIFATRPRSDLCSGRSNRTPALLERCPALQDFWRLTSLLRRDCGDNFANVHGKCRVESAVGRL